MNKQFHAWLQFELPASAKQIATDLTKLHKALPKSYAGFPQPQEVGEALAVLAEGGLVRCDIGGVWFWMNEREPVKVEPQLELFA